MNGYGNHATKACSMCIVTIVLAPIDSVFCILSLPPILQVHTLSLQKTFQAADSDIYKLSDSNFPSHPPPMADYVYSSFLHIFGSMALAKIMLKAFIERLIALELNVLVQNYTQS